MSWRNYHVQNVIMTLCIVLISGAGYVVLSAGSNVEQGELAKVLAQVESPPKAETKLMPGDERTGMPDRTVCRAEDGTLRSVEARFNNGVVVSVECDLLGRPLKAVETTAEGDKQTLVFQPGKRKLPTISIFRADMTLRKEICRNVEGGIEFRHFAADGKTLVCRQVQKLDGALCVSYFHADGKTLKTEYVQKSVRSSVLKIYAENGVLFQEENTSFVASTDKNDQEMQKVVEVIGYDEDGKSIIFRRKGLSSFPDYRARLEAARQSIMQMAMDYFFPFFSRFRSNEVTEAETIAVEIYDGAAYPAKRLHVLSDGTVLRQESLNAKGKVVDTLIYSGKQTPDKTICELAKRCVYRENVTHLRPFMRVNVEHNHLHKALADL
ncbi:MAG: hypothetical protein K2W82_10645 [Candidatus Obscuribacterales bacterium]|nr:hypothetical protein [Candidatus Obscuribacterales bacterium]